MTMTITYAIPPNEPHPTYVLEWDHTGIANPVVSGGRLAVTGNSHTNAYKGRHRGFSKRRYGGPGKALIVRTRMLCTAASITEFEGTFAGNKIGFKFPEDPTVTGLSKDDWRSVVGGKFNPGSIIAVCGIGPEGRFEVSRGLIGPAGFLPFPTPKLIGSTVGVWKQVTIRLDQFVDSSIRVRMWHSADHSMSDTPLYDFSGDGPAPADKVFIWFRNDYCDWEYDYLAIEELTL